MPARLGAEPGGPDPDECAPLTLVLFRDALLPPSLRRVDDARPPPGTALVPALVRTDAPARLSVTLADASSRLVGARPPAGPPEVPGPPAPPRATEEDVTTEEPVRPKLFSGRAPPPRAPAVRREITGTEWVGSSHGCGAEMNTEPAGKAGRGEGVGVGRAGKEV
jgi:hypothetical protein